MRASSGENKVNNAPVGFRNPCAEHFALATVAIGVAVLVAAGIAAKGWICEEYYLHKLQSKDDNDVRLGAQMLTREISPRGISFIVNLVKTKPNLAREILQKFSWSNAKLFVPLFVSLMKSGKEEVVRDVYKELPGALERLGERGPKPMATYQWFSHEPHRDRRAFINRDPIVQALERLGPEASEGLPLLQLLLPEKDSTLAWYAAQAMGRMGGAAVNVLRADLHSMDPQVRMLSAYALGEVEADRKVVLPDLRELLIDTDGGVRWAASGALKKIDGMQDEEQG